jgi:hypothetical protein
MKKINFRGSRCNNGTPEWYLINKYCIKPLWVGLPHRRSHTITITTTTTTTSFFSR